MIERARTIAPIVGVYIDRTQALSRRIELAAGVSIEPPGEELERVAKAIGFIYGHHGESSVRQACALLVSDDTGAPPRDPERDIGGEASRLVQYARRKLHLASLALWLAKPTAFGFEYTARFEGPLETVQGPDWPIRPLSAYQEESLGRDDIQRGSRILSALVSVPAGTALRSALVMLSHGLMDPEGAIRFTLIWIAIEALFGPDDRRRVGDRISRRAGAFLAGVDQNAASITAKVIQNWRARCAVIHGLRIESLPKDSEGIVFQAEEVIRAALIKISSTQEYVSIFSGTERDQFLTRIAPDLPRKRQAEFPALLWVAIVAWTSQLAVMFVQPA